MTPKARVRRALLRVPGAMPAARLTVETIRVCLRYRVTGLASEAGFFMLLSLPPLVLGLFGGVGYVGGWLGNDIVNDLIKGIQDFSSQFLVANVVDQIILPTANDVLQNGRGDLISLGFLLSIWSGSRALNVFVDTISIMYGQSGERGIVRTRALSLTLYFLSLLVGIIVIPLVVIGPSWLGDLLPQEVHFLTYLYWPVVSMLAVASIATLFHISTPRRSPWLRDVPGAVLTLVIWVLASFVLRGTLTASVSGGTSIYGPLSTPIVLLIFLYALAIAVLIGAALNAAIRAMWPVEDRLSLRAKGVEWAKGWVQRRKDTIGPVSGHDALAGTAAVAAAQADEELSTSVQALRDEARKPLTPMPRTPGTDTDDTQFGDDADDRIMSARTRSG
ncbi:YihY/virulence factor BrkB family protein [Pedococcus bigeumensis]|uniref:YihY/virulence factor BrkB family protein n=1 Tax=Pedococcus bigeumensis TaxID=433644 RepID=UPI0031E46E16